jgi:hypothetical protein
MLGVDGWMRTHSRYQVLNELCTGVRGGPCCCCRHAAKKCDEILSSNVSLSDYMFYNRTGEDE